MTGAASVKDRLKNRAEASGKTMQELLILYGLERTIYRMSLSEYKDSFTLKGGIFLYALSGGAYARATRDIDLLAGNVTNDREYIREVFEKILLTPSDDALQYDLETLVVRDITEFQRYHGVNVSVTAFLDRTRIPVSIDIGFGDPVYPHRVEMEFPVLLDADAPKIYAYSLSSAVAEKFEAIVSLGNANSRYKDFYDICFLAGQFDFDGAELAGAIEETFSYRETRLDSIAAFDKEFSESEIHKRRWHAFLKKKQALIPMEFREATNLLYMFLEPVVYAIRTKNHFSKTWDRHLMDWK